MGETAYPQSASEAPDDRAGRQDPPQCTVFYDGSCPLCQREIAMYQGLDRDGSIRWHDVSQVGTGSADLTQEDAMARFHIRQADGTLISGARGFIAVMTTLPRLRWLGRLLSVPPIPWLAEGAYRLFLPLRPVLKKLVPPPKRAPRNDAA